ncbi:MAG: O-methyltransferase [Bacteroidota bacterium]
MFYRYIYHAFFQIREFLIWYRHSKKLHGIHSPFVFGFLKDCVFADVERPEMDQPEEHRSELLADNTVVVFQDYGAGNRLKPNKPGSQKIKKQTVSSIAKNSLHNPRDCRLFFRMIRYFECEYLLEMGTSLGITTSYLALANPNAKIDTLEGAEPIAQMAKKWFSNAKLKNTSLHAGEFGEILGSVIADKKYDFIFMDGDHQGEKAWHYFHQLLKHISNDGVLVIDDIRWSASMLKCWKRIQRHPDVTVTIDMFRFGIVFFDQAFSKQNFNIRFL